MIPEKTSPQEKHVNDAHKAHFGFYTEETPPLPQPEPTYRQSLSRRSSFGEQGSPVKRARYCEYAPMEMSESAKTAINPIRHILENIVIDPNPSKSLIKLNIGDPTITGALPSHPALTEGILKSLISGRYNGYGPAVGFPEVRKALADVTTTPFAPVTAADIIMTSGCSHALQIAIEGLASPGQNILIPRPGFPLYTTLMVPLNIEPRFYDLDINNNWEVDLTSLETAIDKNTAAIVINNPSNPTGAVYSRKHLSEIKEVARKYRLPIIGDEIYGDMVHNDVQFHPLATVEPKIPVISCDGLSKRWLVPGWRLGWIVIHDPFDVLTDVRQGFLQLAQKLVGPCALIQGALPHILKDVPKAFFDNSRKVLQKNAEVAMEELKRVPGITVVPPKGAMYMMLGIAMDNFPQFSDELEMTQAILREESVFCLPGTAFHFPGSLRIVLTYPPDVMQEACRRMGDFFERHYSDGESECPLLKIPDRKERLLQNPAYLAQGPQDFVEEDEEDGEEPELHIRNTHSPIAIATDGYTGHSIGLTSGHFEGTGGFFPRV